ncbi:MAG: hypothetical protein NVSMB58_36730 [Terriglobales bacterium]
MFRRYWFVMKFRLAIFATIALLMHQFAVMGVAAKRVSGLPLGTLFSAEFSPLKTDLVRAPCLSIV